MIYNALVSGESLLTIGGNLIETISGNKLIQIEGDLTETVDGDVVTILKATHQLTIDGAATETYKNNRSITISGNLTETITGDHTITVKGDMYETVDGSRTIKVNGNMLETVIGKSELCSYTEQTKIETGGDILLKTTQGSKDIKLSTNGTGKTHITNDTNISATNNVPSDVTGSLIVDGGVYIKKDTWIGQNLNVIGNINVKGNYSRINTDNIVVDDPLIVLGLQTTDTNIHSGFVNRYTDGPDNFKFTGLVKHKPQLPSDNKFDYHLFTDIDYDMAMNNKEAPSSSQMVEAVNNEDEDKHGNIFVKQIKSLNDNDLTETYLTSSNAYLCKRHCFNIFSWKFRE